MILAWILSLLLLCSSLIMHLERLSVLKVMNVQSIETTQNRFMASEQSVIECEKHFFNIEMLPEHDCVIQLIDKNTWSITSKQKPIIQIHVHVNKDSGEVSRINWRQLFD
jgi:hypothetical protein